MTVPVSLDLLLDVALADAARAYARAYVDCLGADRVSVEQTVARDWALHQLLLAAGEPCGCDPGTCPSEPREIHVPAYPAYSDYVRRVVPNPAYL